MLPIARSAYILDRIRSRSGTDCYGLWNNALTQRTHRRNPPGPFRLGSDSMTSSSSSSSSSSSKRSRSRSRSGSPSRFKTRVLPAAAALANVLHERHEQHRRHERLESPAPAQAAATASPKGSVPINERSPLLSPSPGDSEQTFLGPGPGPGLLEHDAVEEETQKTKSFWYLVLLTISIGGLQIAWSVELSNGSPYLLSLGLSKSMMALVWIAGPLTGTLVQPYIGMLSDNCRVSWGKRKPFMIGGALATACSLLFLSWTKEIVGGLLGFFGADPQSQGVKVVIIVVAVIWVYILDVAINTGKFAPLTQVARREDTDPWAQYKLLSEPSSWIAHRCINKVT